MAPSAPGSVKQPPPLVVSRKRPVLPRIVMWLTDMRKKKIAQPLADSACQRASCCGGGVLPTVAASVAASFIASMPVMMRKRTSSAPMVARRCNQAGVHSDGGGTAANEAFRGERTEGFGRLE